jgi:hypothetical protein
MSFLPFNTKHIYEKNTIYLICIRRLFINK